jgi:AcrR family transcriptional regulator
LDEIAERLGVTKPALYQYFPGKEDLFAAVAERSRQELKGSLELSYRKRNIRDGSTALFDSLLAYAPQFSSMFSEMMLLSAHNERPRIVLHQDRTEDSRIIEHFITSQQETGYVSPRLNSRNLAIACDALVNGLLLDIMAGLDKEEAKKIWLDTVIRLVQDT